MTAPIPGEQFVRTLRHYLEANQNRLLVTTTPQLSSLQEIEPQTNNVKETDNGILKSVSSLWTSSRKNNHDTPNNNNNNKNNSNNNSRPASLYGIPIPYMSLLAASSPNATCLSNTPYMPLRSSLTLDIHYLYFLLVQFEYLGLEETHLPVPEEHGLVETETTQSIGQAPSIVSSVGSVMSTLSLSTGWQFWSNGEGEKEKRPLHEDIVYIHRFFSKITALKLHMNHVMIDKGVAKSGQRSILGYETPIPQDGSLSLPLTCFGALSYLELNHIHPSLVSNWNELRSCLVSCVIRSCNVDNAADIIGDQTWPQLKMLSLADNSLTTLENEPANLIRSVTHLNLSSNLLIDIPSAMASLYNLTSLNLSYNMISFTTGINTVLGNIQELDLRGNRLTVLAGLERLWALERLDVRDNRIEDIGEIGRLTSLPNVFDIWVEGNPFTKVKTEYRIDLFNVFKKSDLDIQLDGSRPTFSEKRHIHGNPEHHGPSTPKAVSEEPKIPKWPSATLTQQQLLKQQQNHDDSDQNSITSHSTAPAAIQKTKKLARAKTKGNKRVIRLGQSETNKNDPLIGVLSDDEESKKYVHRLAELEEAVQEERVIARRAASVRSRRSKKASSEESKSLTAESTSEITKQSSDAFRRKIEAMRKEAGTEWLRVLQEMDVVKKQNPPADK